MNKKLKHIFNDDGNFRFSYDPFRTREADEHFHSSIFDEEGDVLSDVWSNISKELKKNQYPFDSDIVKVYYAEWFSGNTKGNYSAIYMWR